MNPIYKKKSLKLPNWYPEFVNRRMTDSTITKRKWTQNNQTMIRKTLNINTKDLAIRTHQKSLLCLQQTEYICGHPCQRYSLTVNEVMMMTVNHSMI